MATDPKKKKDSPFDRLRRGVAGFAHSLNETFGGEIDELTGRRVKDFSPQEYAEYAERGRRALPQPTPAMRASAAGFATPTEPAILPDNTGIPDAPRSAIFRAAVTADPREPQFVRSAREAQAFQERGKQLGTTPLEENLPGRALPDIDPFERDEIVEESPFPVEEMEEPTHADDLKRTGAISQAMRASEALDAHETPEERAEREEAEIEAALAARGRPAEMSATGRPINVPPESRERVREGLKTAGRTALKPAAYAAREIMELAPEDEDVDQMSLMDVATLPGRNIAKRLGRAADIDTSEIQGGEGMLADLAGDVVMGMGARGLLRTGLNAARRAAPAARSLERVDEAWKRANKTRTGRSVENALEEAAIYGTLGGTDPEFDVGALEAGATAGALTVPFEGALSRAGRAVRGVANEVGRTARATGRAIGLSGQLDEGTRQQYQQVLKSAGLGNDVVAGLSDRELTQAMKATAPQRMYAGGRLTGDDKLRAQAAGGLVAASAGAGVVASGQGGDRGAEGQEGADTAAIPQDRPDPNGLLALAGSLAMARKPKQAKEIVTSLVGRSADEAIKLMRRAGMNQQADNFATFINGSQVKTPVFHGTFNSFDEYAAPREHAASGGFYGSRDVAYFTSEPIDASGNYADMSGPDIESKIAMRAERIMDEWENSNFSDPWGEDAARIDEIMESGNWSERYAIAEEAAKRELFGDSPAPNVQPVWLRMQRPAEVIPGAYGRGGGTRIRFEWEEDEYGDFIDESVTAINSDGSEFAINFADALRRVVNRYEDAHPDEVLATLNDKGIGLPGDEVSLWEIDNALREALPYVTDPDTGDFAQGQLISDLYREMGFDGIIMDAHAKFGTRGMPNVPEGTKHYITFAPGQIKSVTGNSGTFDWTNPNITLGVAGLAMLGHGAMTSGVEGQVDIAQQASEAGIPAVALAGMTRRKGVRFLSPRGLRNTSKEYQLVANRIGYDPAAVGSGVINQGLVRSYEDFRQQMSESMGDRFADFEDDLPTVFAESIELAIDQAFPKIPAYEGKGTPVVAEVAQRLLKIGKGRDRLTDIWGDPAQSDARMKRASTHGVREALKALVLLGDSARWYRADVDNSINALRDHYGKPGVLSDAEKALYGESPMAQPAHQTLFKAILAVTSNGNKVMKNMETADKIYRHFLQTGQLTLFVPGTRQRLAISKYTLGAADVLGISANEAAELKKAPAPEGSTANNALDHALEERRVLDGLSSKDMDALVRSAGDDVVGTGDAPTVSMSERGIWAGELHSPGIGHSRANIHEEQLMRLQRVMATLGGTTEDVAASPEGITALDSWLTQRYLGGKASEVTKALEVLGDPPPVNAPQEAIDDYLRRLREYRLTHGLETDDLLVQYHSIAGPESRKNVVKARGGPTSDAMEQGLSDKIGRFFLNLYGVHDEATVDLWATRWFRRVMGHAEVKGGKLNDAPLGWEKGEIREAFTRIADGLTRETGRPWVASDIQSLLWYWEKELYRLAGARDSDKVSYAMAAEAVTGGNTGNREWITQQMESISATKEAGISTVKALRAQARANPNNGSIPTLEYGDLKTEKGLSFAAAPIGMALPMLEGEEGEGDAGKAALAVLGGAALAAAGGRAIGRKILGGKAGDPDEWVPDSAVPLLKMFDEAPINLDKGEELLTDSERIYSRAIDLAYPLAKVAEKTNTPELIQQARVSLGGWQRAAEQRIKRELGEVLAVTKGNEKKVTTLAMAQRELELRAHGVGERLDFTDEQLQEMVDDLSSVPEVENAAERLRAFYRDLIDRKLEEGVIDRETYDRIVAKGEYYVPMVRDFGFGKPTVTGTGSSRLANAWHGVRRLTKGEVSDEKKRMPIVDPFQQAVHDAIQTERAIAKQRVTNIVANVVRQNPEAMVGLIKEVVNPLKDLGDQAVLSSKKAVDTASSELAKIRGRITDLEQKAEGLRKKDLTKQRWKDSLKKTEKAITAARVREAKQEQLVQQRQKEFEERESQARAKAASGSVPPGRLVDLRRVEAIVDGKKKTYEVLDEDLFNAWAAAPPQVQDTMARFLSPAKRLLQTTVTALPDFGIANALRDNFMTGTQYPLALRRMMAVSGVGAIAGAAMADDDAKSRTLGSVTGASLAALPFSAQALTKHAARTFYAMRDVLAGQANAGRAGGAFGAMIGGGVGASVAEEGDRLEGAAAGAAAGAGAGNMGARLMAKYGDPAVYERWVSEGGAGFGFFPRTNEDTKKLLNEIRMNGVDPRSIIHPKSIWDSIQIMNQVIEEAPRVARFKERMAAGDTPLAAAASSRDISLDFSRHGSSKGIQTINESTAFYNAKLQGASKLIRMLKDPKTWGVGMATLTAPTIALWNLNKDNAEYKARPTWEKNLFWHIPKSAFGAGEGSGFWLMPKPFEVGFIFASVPERILDWMHEEDPELLNYSLGNMMGQTFEGFIPIPTLAKPLGEAAFNIDTFRGMPVVGRHLQDQPTQQQFDNRTSSLARGIGKVTDVAGMLPGVPDEGISPEKIDHVISGYTGGMGRLANQAIDATARTAGVDTRPVSASGRSPIVGRFNSDPTVVTEPESMLRRRFAKAQGAYRSVNRYLVEGANYEQLENAIRAGDVNKIKSLVKQGQGPEVGRFLQENLDQLNEYKRLKESKRILDQAAQARRAIDNDPNMSKEQKRKLLAAVNRMVGEEARKVARAE